MIKNVLLSIIAFVLITGSPVAAQKESAKESKARKLEKRDTRSEQVVAQSGQGKTVSSKTLEQPYKKRKPTKEELKALRNAAASEAEQKHREKKATEKVFKSGGLGLQALNPEISVTGDFLNIYRDSPSENEFTDFEFRGLGVHFEAYLDPYSRFKAAIPISLEGAELGEAYFNRYDLFKGMNVTLGKFRQQFGVVNRWHKHALDWLDFPLPLRMIFGPGGLNQLGLSLDWSGATGSITHSFEVQATGGTNGKMFGENSRKRPSILGRYKFYHDLSPSTYVQLGLTGLVGWNDKWEGSVPESIMVEKTLDVEVYGADFTLLWEPTSSMRYRNIEWRSELYYVNKNIMAPDGSGQSTLNPWGVYSSLQAKVSRTVDIGVRCDYYEPDTKSYAADSVLSLASLAVTKDGAYRWLVAPYITWWQSPFVKFRLEYNHEDGLGMGEHEDRVTFQMVFAAGPHKHERY